LVFLLAQENSFDELELKGILLKGTITIFFLIYFILVQKKFIVKNFCTIFCYTIERL
jgi:hypothetical protein